MTEPLHIPGVVLWIGACLGHGFMWVVFLNWLFSFDIPHKILDFARSAGILLILSAPVLFLDGLRFPNDLPLTYAAIMSPNPWSVFVRFCFMMGVFVAPVCQLAYWLRPRPTQLIRRDSDI